MKRCFDPREREAHNITSVQRNISRTAVVVCLGSGDETHDHFLLCVQNADTSWSIIHESDHAILFPEMLDDATRSMLFGSLLEFAQQNTSGHLPAYLAYLYHSETATCLYDIL